ncbi:hypothetical protein ROLI_013660 [Roseobacter fucihabitans]|uniref:Peptidase S26 domain-containing protein n=1 Tax=Roseobacter fucihabitans TaxID=1537242 RepID=A0ABZ2BQM7_9RHOB|nr:S26 family signal peptidase [Roseobacter litoralis]MBC6967011.1 Peptidase S26 [Roseobacter litoralis]
MSAAAPPLLAVGLSLGLIAVAQADRAPWFIWNASESVPVGLYALHPSQMPSLGDLAAVRMSTMLTAWVVERGYVGADVLLLKRTAAVSGMTVCRKGLAISIDGAVIAQAAVTDRHGRALPRWFGCVTLTSDQVFLLNAGVADSLDGRYFGPLQIDSVIGSAVPIWISEGASDA